MMEKVEIKQLNRVVSSGIEQKQINNRRGRALRRHKGCGNSRSIYPHVAISLSDMATAITSDKAFRIAT
jgi:hypothetical protein